MTSPSPRALELAAKWVEHPTHHTHMGPMKQVHSLAVLLDSFADERLEARIEALEAALEKADGMTQEMRTHDMHVWQSLRDAMNDYQSARALTRKP